ncbi:MAG: HAD-IC family P-type ATPase, partial [Candidatus Jordarchaeaceae archaeon]
NGRIEKMNGEYLRVIEERISKLAGEGLRVIAVAYNELQDGESFKDKKIESNLIFVGLAGMKDPPRPEIKESISIAKKAGIRTIIITGDYGLTAQRIAQEVGIIESDSDPGSRRVITGIELDNMSDQQILEEIKAGCSIFALVTPVQKLRIVKILRENGEIVAVTGDGANDSPSLREADIGVAMGVSGTDIAREASDMVLLDDSFTSIVKAVESGRTVYDNIRKYITYVFTHNWAELIPFILYVVFGLPLPLLIIQVLAIDIGIDIIPSLALSQEPPEKGIMEQAPRSIKERLFSRGVFLRSLYLGIIIAAGAMFGCLNAWASGGWVLGMQLDPHSAVYIKGVTMTFAGIVVGQMGNVLACRTSKASLFKTSLTSNKWIWVGLASQIIILTLMIYAPLMQNIFGTTALGLNEWAYLALIAGAVILAEEVRKWLARTLQETSWLPKLNQKISSIKEVVMKYT